MNQYRPGQVPEPKSFFWIPVQKDKPPVKATPVWHQVLSDWNGSLSLEIEVASEYLYVGSGVIEVDQRQRAYYAFTRCDGQLVISATSIKGAVRSVLEAISNSCVSQTGRGEKLPSRDHRWCEVDRRQQDASRLCPACRLFGSTGYRGRLHFTDATSVDRVSPAIIKIADLWPPRQARGRKLYQNKAFRRLDDRPAKNHRFLEAMPRGSRFRTTLFFTNTTTGEMGLLLRALGLERRDNGAVRPVFPVKLGGGKPRCLGGVQFGAAALKVFSPSGPGFWQALAEGGIHVPVQETLREWLEDTSLLDREAWERFQKEVAPRQEQCPRGLY